MIVCKSPNSKQYMIHIKEYVQGTTLQKSVIDVCKY